MRETEYVTCLRCKWISYPVTRKYAEENIKRFNAYFDTLDDEQKSHYKSYATDKDYLCRCGNDTFGPTRETELSRFYGHTISPVIYEPEKPTARSEEDGNE